MKFNTLIQNFSKHSFLFQQLVKRDFEHKYKRTSLGMLWSVLSPLLTLLVMRIVFTDFFGRNTPHYTIYLFSGNIVFSYFREATNNGMTSLMNNANVIEKINVPKYLFLLSRNVQAFFNFLLTVLVYFLFCIIDHIDFGWHMLSLVYPVLCLLLLNIGVGLILSAVYIFFRDMTYLYGVFLTLLNYMSAIFYTLDNFSEKVQRLFLLNPVYVIIKYFRMVVIDGHLPSTEYHLLMLGYSCFFVLIGMFMYKKYNHQFVYYL
ncbi:MAG: ABC transporter permease [Solobacterium sp.]|nr:ABC transporter permease [Solobacterium sp.]